MIDINRQEFEGYITDIQGENIIQDLEGESAGNISKLQSKLAVWGARVGQALARHKNEVRDEVLRLMNLKDETTGKGMAGNKAEPQAEQTIDTKKGVSRRELENLRDDMKNIGIACSSRIASLRIEKFTSGKSDDIEY